MPEHDGPIAHAREHALVVITRLDREALDVGERRAVHIEDSVHPALRLRRGKGGGAPSHSPEAPGTMRRRRSREEATGRAIPGGVMVNVLSMTSGKGLPMRGATHDLLAAQRCFRGFPRRASAATEGPKHRRSARSRMRRERGADRTGPGGAEGARGVNLSSGRKRDDAEG